MKKRVFSALFGSLFLALVVAACGGNTTPSTGSSGGNNKMMSGMSTATSGSNPMTDSLKGLSGKDFEVQFLQEMIAHAQSAVALAQLIPTHTKRAELGTLAQDIISAQKKEISEMTTWLSTWYHEKPVADSISVPGMMEMMGNVDQLKNARNAEFDKLFLTIMITHHYQAVNMANLLPEKTQRPELLKLGQEMVKTQSAEIQHMQGWQQKWFQS